MNRYWLLRRAFVLLALWAVAVYSLITSARYFYVDNDLQYNLKPDGHPVGTTQQIHKALAEAGGWLNAAWVFFGCSVALIIWWTFLRYRRKFLTSRIGFEVIFPKGPK